MQVLTTLGSGRPESGLHMWPSTDTKPVPAGRRRRRDLSSGTSGKEWHSDITFEPAPSDCAILEIHTLPNLGGDTLWSNSYEAYDRLIPSFAKFLKGITALHDGGEFTTAAATCVLLFRFVSHFFAAMDRLLLVHIAYSTLFAGPRGNLGKVRLGLTAVHSVIRTTPVTGWKGVFVNRGRVPPPYLCSC